MISPHNSRKGLVLAASLCLLAMLAGCVSSEEALLSTGSTPARAGRYELQYLVDGKWTKVATGALALVNRTYSWAEDREALSLLHPGPFRFALANVGNNVFVIVVASTDLKNPIWTGHYIYGIARRAGKVFLYDFPSCLDLLASQGFTDEQIEKVKAHECLYSNQASLTAVLIAYAKRTAMRKRLAPSSR